MIFRYGAELEEKNLRNMGIWILEQSRVKELLRKLLLQLFGTGYLLFRRTRRDENI